MFYIKTYKMKKRQIKQIAIVLNNG